MMRPIDRVAAGAGAVTVAAMIATPLLPRRGRGRRILSSVVVVGMWTTTTADAVRRWGAARAGAAAVSTAVATGVVERIGTRTGFPFGRYAYTDALQPQIAHVPVIVPLAWFGMGLPAREVAHTALGGASTPSRRIALGAAAMTAWDLFLDPQMVGEGYWAWQRRGLYRTIPMTNYLGWFATGIGIMTVFEMVLPVGRHGGERTADGTADASDSSHDVRLAGWYGYMSVMQTLGFARYFRDPLVALVGGLGMIPIAAAAAARVIRARR
jgi:uncharacterized membrane protein